ncbi:MAG: SufB/SufD family protein [Methanosarcina flavescens]|jgi:Fe-S cluster assembly scaffold protein SufB|uniref:SufD family Fe-S cluster assembly protein n=1 Tax=Methanosarcina flavescens TaxID=1715806 RepID=A0A660HSM4_9EURY|nr:SufD family Fe-S cluster assembly protein [Methanosarcina flavescens]AYK15129.1 SufD family Fe-S cluster assembly protein [Methanosarcina flavescens]NLK32057.1 SufD family Fe-S cluster assembly protein [Methanosarcina flavescens]
MQNDDVNLKKRAEEAAEKKAAFGEDFELEKFEEGSRVSKPIEDLQTLDEESKRTLLQVGVIPSEEGRSGSLLVLDNAVSHSSLKDKNVELMSTRKALQKYEWLKEYSWKLVAVDTDKYTAKTYLEDADGYFIRVPPGKKSSMPVQTCLLLGSDRAFQTVHNIVIVEEGASLDIITGCTAKKEVEEGLHLGISEMYVKKGATLNFTMIHNWAEQIGVRPRTVIHVEEGGTYVSNYVCLKPVRSVQTYPTVKLEGEGAVTRLNTIAIAHSGSELDLGSRAVFNAPGTKAELISRTITIGGKIVARGEMIGNAKGAKGHLECKGLVLTDKGSQLAIPILEANVDDVELTHEAAVGKIAKDQVEYLMARGLNEDEAVGMIVRGFLDVGIRGIPEELKNEIENTIAQTAFGM